MAILTNAILFVVVVVLQLTLAPLFAIKEVAPDLILIFVILISFQRGRIWGMVLAFGVGLTYDALSAGLIGLSSLACIVSAFVVGLWSKQTERRFSAIFAPLLLIVFIHDFLYFLVMRIGSSTGFWITLFTIILPSTMYNLLILCIIYFAAPSTLLHKRS